MLNVTRGFIFLPRLVMLFLAFVSLLVSSLNASPEIVVDKLWAYKFLKTELNAAEHVVDV